MAKMLTMAATAPAAAATCSSGVPGDVNGDGRAEVAVSENGHKGGGVHIFYGTSKGLTVKASGNALDDQYVDQSTAGVPGTNETGDAFGARTAFGDFNDDGCADLAIAAPGENDGSGSVTVLYGSKAGITTVGAATFTMDSLFAALDNAGFGYALAVGDLDDDGVDDLAVGASQYSFGGGERAGGAAVIYGDPIGLNKGATDADLLTQDSPGVPGDAADQAYFGTSVAVGDFDGDEVAELAVGAPGAGVVQTFERGAGGYGNVQPDPLTEESLGVQVGTEGEDGFGFALASGDVHAEFYGSGAVVLVRGSSTGLGTLGKQFWTQDSPGVSGEARNEDAFGLALAMGPLNAGPNDDLAIGAPQDWVGSKSSVGSVTVLLGSAGGLTTGMAGGTRWHQDSPGIGGAVERRAVPAGVDRQGRPDRYQQHDAAPGQSGHQGQVVEVRRLRLRAQLAACTHEPKAPPAFESRARGAAKPDGSTLGQLIRVQERLGEHVGNGEEMVDRHRFVRRMGQPDIARAIVQGRYAGPGVEPEVTAVRRSVRRWQARAGDLFMQGDNPVRELMSDR